MLYPTLNQPVVILVMFAAGIVGGLAFDACRILSILAKADKTAKHILEFLATLICFILFFVGNLFFNYGQIRVYTILIFLLSFALERKLSQKLWTKLVEKWYSIVVGRITEWKKKRNKN